MNQRRVEQLDKVLALVDSSHEGEAIGAVRMARRMLSRDGLSFGDLARAAANRSRFSLPRTFFSGQNMHLEAQIAQLQKKINDMVGDNQSLATQIDFWRRRAYEMEQQLNLSQSDAQRWKHWRARRLKKIMGTSAGLLAQTGRIPQCLPKRFKLPKRDGRSPTNYRRRKLSELYCRRLG